MIISHGMCLQLTKCIIEVTNTCYLIGVILVVRDLAIWLCENFRFSFRPFYHELRAGAQFNMFRLKATTPRRTAYFITFSIPQYKIPLARPSDDLPHSEPKKTLPGITTNVAGISIAKVFRFRGLDVLFTFSHLGILCGFYSSRASCVHISCKPFSKGGVVTILLSS